MKTPSSFSKHLCLAVLLFACSTLHGQITTITITDESGAEGPLQLSGQVLCNQSTAPSDQLRTVITGTLSSINVSLKRVVAYVAALHITPPIGQHSRLAFQNDCLFLEHLFNPNETMTDQLDSDSTEPNDSNTNPSAPAARARVLWVQFADGSEYGSSSQAWQMLGTRSYLLDKLQTLIRTYNQAGETAFSQELMADYSNFRAGPFIKTIRRIYDQDGIARALRAVRHLLHNAQTHLNVMKK